MKKRTIEVSQETYNKIKEQLLDDEKIDISSLEDFIGKSMFFRTVTYHLLGRVVKVLGNYLQLEEASFVADSGRFMEFIDTGIANEVEPINTEWFVNLSACTDFGMFHHELPKKQK